MPTYKGNVGNLMQHWTLCELVNIAQEKDIPGLNFIDAHAMAPRATENNGKDDRFKGAENRLRNFRTTAYERAWHNLTPSGSGYPNSAALVTQVWKGDFSLLLCETDAPTIAKLKLWCEGIGNLKRCTSPPELHEGNWRQRFDQPQGIPSPGDVGLEPGSLTLVSLDPYWYDPNRNFGDGENIDSGNLYRDDLVRLLRSIGNVPDPVVIQLSTYSNAYGRARRAVVRPQINEALIARGFVGVMVPALNAANHVHQGMMSLVYARGLDEWDGLLQDLPHCFAQWVRAIPARRR